MSKAYQFPHDEPNPFAEATPAAPAPGDNPYASGAEAAQKPVLGADAYQQTLVPRSGLVLGLSVTSLVGALVAVVVSFWCLPLGVFVLMLSMPTVAMAQHDLKAMKLGAMDSENRGTVQVALVLAIISSVASALSLIVPVAMAIWAWSVIT